MGTHQAPLVVLFITIFWLQWLSRVLLNRDHVAAKPLQKGKERADFTELSSSF